MSEDAKKLIDELLHVPESRRARGLKRRPVDDLHVRAAKLISDLAKARPLRSPSP